MPDPFTDEDRQALAGLVRENRPETRYVEGRFIEVPDVLTRALAYIDHLEALQRADAMPTSTLYERERRADALASARAALKGEDDA